MKSDERIAAIDYLKAISIILVIINHSWPTSMKEMPIFIFLIRMAVPIFMVVSGYTFAMSYCKYKNIKEMYSLKTMIPKFVRFTVPVTITYMLYIIYQIAEHNFSGVKWIVRTFVAAEFGKGSYYYIILVQLILVFPIIFMTMKKFKYGLFIIGIANLAYELAVHIIDIGIPLYRIIFFRYLLFVGAGVFLYLYRNITLNKLVLIMSFAIGSIYLLSYNYFGYQLKLFTYQPWANTSMISAFYIFPVIYIVFQFKDFRFKENIDKLLSNIGKSSYQILFIQMMYFWFIDRVYPKTNCPLPIYIVANIAICLTIGIFYFRYDNIIVNALNNILIPKNKTLEVKA